jgi:hypothetical protein
MIMELKNVQLGHHLVSFLDVLGQREKFKSLYHPKTPEQTAEVTEILKDTVGVVLDLRKKFNDQYKIFESGLTNLKKISSEPVHPKFVGFSDSFITSTPLRNKNSEVVPFITIFAILSAAAVVMQTSLASKHPLRGGIDIGLAVEIDEREIYGAAMGNAYLLESEVAEYPRIVIGDELWEYLNVARGNFSLQETPESKLILNIIETRITKLIATDNDGKRIVDYLGPFMREIAGTDLNASEISIKPLYEFVLAEQAKVNEAKKLKLIPRYEAFRNYVESRLHLWGIVAVKN